MDLAAARSNKSALCIKNEHATVCADVLLSTNQLTSNTSAYSSYDARQ